MLPDPQLFQNDETQEQPPPDRPSPEPGPETPQTIPETHPAQHASGPVGRTTFRKNIQCPDKWACCFVFPRSVAPGLNKQALTPTRGRDEQQLLGVWARMLGSDGSEAGARAPEPLWEASALYRTHVSPHPTPKAPGFPPHEEWPHKTSSSYNQGCWASFQQN